MSINDVVFSVLKELSENSIDYCILRNYKFLISKELLDGDVDIVVVSNQISGIKTIMQRLSFIKTCENARELKYAKYLASSKKIISFHFAIGAIYFHSVPFMNAETILKSKREISSHVSVPSSESLFLELILHSLFRGKLKPTYLRLLIALKSKVNIDRIRDFLTKNFGKLGKALVQLIEHGEFLGIISFRRKAIASLLFRNPVKFLIDAAISRVGFRKKKVIAVIGVDGVGKTTIINYVSKILKENSIFSKQVYMGRWREKSAVASIVSKLSTNSNRATKRYQFVRSVNFVFDLYLRYLTKISRAKGAVLLDRYANDFFLLRNRSKFGELALNFYPKPDLTVLLKASSEELARRGYAMTKEQILKCNSALRKAMRGASLLEIESTRAAQDIIVEKIINLLLRARMY